MDINEAAERLNQRLREYDWFMAVAVGGLDEKEVIFVYTRRVVRSPELDRLTDSGWMGHDVKVERVGRIQPAY